MSSLLKRMALKKTIVKQGLAIEFVKRGLASCSKQNVFNLNPVLTMIGLDEAPNSQSSGTSYFLTA